MNCAHKQSFVGVTFYESVLCGQAFHLGQQIAWCEHMAQTAMRRDLDMAFAAWRGGALALEKQARDIGCL
jgi:hypothetical protein